MTQKRVEVVLQVLLEDLEEELVVLEILTMSISKT
jgi:hypothetical protein